MAGTPILYYKANTNFKQLACMPPPQAQNSIYNYNDNVSILRLGILPKPDPVNKPHRLSQPFTYFCDPDYKIIDGKVPPIGGVYYWPNRPDTYILISAGADHNFGTTDDILNF
jgi:hypothetical protein